MVEQPQHSAEQRPLFNVAEMGALSHLYRGEMYRSKIWRTRLDTTTNWAVAVTGIALSISFSDDEMTALPLVLVGFLVTIFLAIEARRYRYFDIWRTRVRLMEVCFFGPILRGERARAQYGWNDVLARDYLSVRFHISFWEAAGRRLRRNYIWIFLVLGASYLAKLVIHPTPAEAFGQMFRRASAGPVPGEVILFGGAAFYLSLLVLSLATLRQQQAAGRVAGPQDIDPISKFRIKV